MGTTPQKLADWLQDKTIYLWDSGDEQYYASPICEDIVPMLRQQQAEIEALKNRELTDEEILQVMMNVYSDTVPPIRGIEFARAILRKA